MSDPRNKLQSMYEERHRFSNFGNVLTQIQVRGFRCHTDTRIEINSPITAFCGLNGTGKSTLLQVAATAYKSPAADGQTYYIKDFLVVGTLDPRPFTDDATVEFRYWQNDRTTKSLTLSRDALTKRWRGYSRRPARIVLFAGVGLYLPKVEQRDFIVRKANHLVVSNADAVPNDVREWTCRILGHNYDHIVANTVTFSRHTGTVTSVERLGTTYSEAHMGYGEGRSQYLIGRLETLPERSLILIEEPETSLHPSAQYALGRYLVDVAIRKRHQILLTTHSEFILGALPSESRVYLKRTDNGIDLILGLTALQAKSLLTEGQVKALTVLVEDNCAATVLCEIIRRTDPDFLRSIGIHPCGDADIIARTVQTLKDTGLVVAAVRDADKGDAPRENIFKLPGNQPPEREMFACEAVKSHIRSTYGVNLDDFLAAELSGVDHHEWFKRLAAHVNQNEAALVSEAARAYVRSLPELEVETLTQLLKEASRR